MEISVETLKELQTRHDRIANLRETMEAHYNELPDESMLPGAYRPIARLIQSHAAVTHELCRQIESDLLKQLALVKGILDGKE